MPVLTPEERLALEQIQDYLLGENGYSHQGYYSHGWAGEQLKNLLDRDRKKKYGPFVACKPNNSHIR
jgi:hypothetical protein